MICPFSDPIYCKGRLFQVDGGRSLLAPLATLGRILPPVTGAAWDDLGWLGMVRRYPTGAGSNLELIWIQLDDLTISDHIWPYLTISDLFFCNWPLDGGFNYFYFPFHIWDNPSHWLSYFSRWFFLTTNQPIDGCRCMVFLTCMSTRQAAKGWAKTSGLLYVASTWFIYIYWYIYILMYIYICLSYIHILYIIYFMLYDIYIYILYYIYRYVI